MLTDSEAKESKNQTVFKSFWTKENNHSIKYIVCSPYLPENVFCQCHKVIIVVFLLFFLIHVKGEGEFIPESQDHVVCMTWNIVSD